MKKVSSVLMAFLLLSAVAWANDGKKKRMALKPTQSELRWVGKKVTGQHNGIVQLKSGSLEVDGDQITSGSFVIDMTTIKVVDIKDEKMNAKLLGHLKSPDFFSVADHPEATFVLREASPIIGGKSKVTGDLTIKGITKEITFPVSIREADGNTYASADFELDRTRWDVRYGSGSFFDGLGDKVIYDDFEIGLELALE